MASSLSSTTSPAGLTNITNLTDRDFVPNSKPDRLAPPPTVQGRAAQMATPSAHQNGNALSNALSDTPAGSAPSTAPASPRL